MQTGLPELTVLNRYALRDRPEAFAAAAGALAARVGTEGEPGVLSYRFWVDAAAGEARAVIDYATPAAWIGHHESAMGWPEMTALHAAAQLVEVRFLGPVTDGIRDWIAGSGLTAQVLEGAVPVAGFRRQGRRVVIAGRCAYGIGDAQPRSATTMKATVTVMLKQGVLDPQGEAVRHALGAMGFGGVEGVRQGKVIELDLAPGTDETTVREMCEKLLANTVIESYRIEMGSA